MASFEEMVISHRRNIEDALRNKQLKRLASLATFNLNRAIQFRNACTEQAQLIDDLKKDGVKLAAEHGRQKETIHTLLNMTNKDNSDLVNSLRVQLAATEIKLETVTDQFDRADIEVVECNATAAFNRLQLDAVRKEAINRISYLTRQNRKLKLEIERLKSENANNPQETTD